MIEGRTQERADTGYAQPLKFKLEMSSEPETTLPLKGINSYKTPIGENLRRTNIYYHALQDGVGATDYGEKCEQNLKFKRLAFCTETVAVLILWAITEGTY